MQLKAVVGREGEYEISESGQLRSLDRITYLTNRWGNTAAFRMKGQDIKPIAHHTGYLVVKMGSGRVQNRIHQLVAWAFLGPQPDGMVINHKDGNKLNNHYTNLEYISGCDNVKHAHRTGLIDNYGDKNGNSRIKRKSLGRVARSGGPYRRRSPCRELA